MANGEAQSHLPGDPEPNRIFHAGDRVFGRYYLKRKLGEGGMGVVWLAHDRLLEQDVALKLLAGGLINQPGAIDRLKSETRRNLKLTHPNIVRIFDFLQNEESAAIAMEYVEGWSLWTMRIDRPNQIFGVTEISPWIHELCEALDYAHTDVKIVHRDLKPANLLVNARSQIKVTDFGLAREVWKTRTSEPTDPQLAGTDFYMSPQQWTGEAAAVADDIYSLGATIYELLTGQPPFYTGDIFEQLHEIVPPSMSERLLEFSVENADIPLMWEEAVAACLEKDAGKRPGSAREVASRLGLD